MPIASRLRARRIWQPRADEIIAAAVPPTQHHGRGAGPRYAQLLDTTIGSALLRIDRVAFVDDLPHHLLSVLLSPSRSRIIVNQHADKQQASEGLAIAHDARRSDT
jgi:GntR family transcriptional regulator